jgi:alpha-L-fucosidase
VTLPLPTAGKTVTASSTAAGSAAANVADGTQKVSWSAAEGHTSGWLEFDLGTATTISGFAFDEPDVWPRLKQTYRLEVADGSGWKTIVSGSTVGHGHTQNFAPVTGQRFRLAMERAGGAPGVAEWRLYRPE